MKNGFGISTKNRKYTTSTPIIGPGQGSKGACAACTRITTPILCTHTRS